MSTTAPATQPGSLFDIPGVQGQTQWFEQSEDTAFLPVAVNQNVQQPVTGIADFRRTDVVLDWRLHFQFTNVSFTAGTGQTLTNSQYAPYNIVGPTKLQIQNQYASVNVESGIDLYILELVRPYRRTAAILGSNNGADPFGAPAGNVGIGYLNAATPQGNLVVPAQWARTSTAFDLYLPLPGGIWLDEYYALSIDGNYLGAEPDVFVSPQYMAGTQRLIKPQITMNPLLGPTTDVAPVQTTSNTATTATASTAAATANLTIRRRGVYGSNSTLTLPPTQPWQYQVTTQRFSIAGQSNVSIKIPDNTGQLLSCWLRLYDPLANGGVGAPIQLSALSTAAHSVQFLYGSGLTWFDGTAEDLQELWLRQRNVLLPQGVLAVDFAVDEQNNITNKRAPNSYTTAGLQWVLQFAAPTSSAAYAVLGTESLVYVTG
jgi:hypothetical protein